MATVRAQPWQQHDITHQDSGVRLRRSDD